MTDTGVKYLLAPGSNSVKCLAALDLSRTKFRGEAFSSLPPTCALRCLKAKHCGRLSKLVLQLPASVPLEELLVQSCPALEWVVVSTGARMHRITIDSCPRLAKIELRCPALRYLCLGNCPELAALSPEDPVALAASGAVDPPPTLQFLGLEELSCFACRSLEGPALDCLLRFAPLLRTANLSGCGSIEALQMPLALELRTLDISGCRALRIAHIGSPVLRDLRAMGCTALRDLSLSSRELRSISVTNCSSLRHVDCSAFLSLDRHLRRPVRTECGGASSHAVMHLAKLAEGG